MDLRAILMGLAFSVMWSSAFTSARIIVMDAPPLTALAVRFALSGVIAVALARALGQHARLTRMQWRSVVIFGICQNALYLGLNFVAMVRVEAGLASIIASIMPLMVALIGWAVFGTRVRPLGLAGLAAGFVGAALIMGTRLESGVDPAGLVMCLVGMVALAVATLSIQGASGKSSGQAMGIGSAISSGQSGLAGGNLLMIVGLQMLVGAVVLAPAALLLETPVVTWSPRLLVAFAYTTVVPGLLATLLWFHLVARIGAVPAATFHFLNPFFGVAVAALLLGERLGHWDILGVAIIAAGILAVQRSRAVLPPV